MSSTRNMNIKIQNEYYHDILANFRSKRNFSGCPGSPWCCSLSAIPIRWAWKGTSSSPARRLSSPPSRLSCGASTWASLIGLFAIVVLTVSYDLNYCFRCIILLSGRLIWKEHTSRVDKEASNRSTIALKGIFLNVLISYPYFCNMITCFCWSPLRHVYTQHTYTSSTNQSFFLPNARKHPLRVYM